MSRFKEVSPIWAENGDNRISFLSSEMNPILQNDLLVASECKPEIFWMNSYLT